MRRHTLRPELEQSLTHRTKSRILAGAQQYLLSYLCQRIGKSLGHLSLIIGTHLTKPR